MQQTDDEAWAQTHYFQGSFAANPGSGSSPGSQICFSDGTVEHLSEPKKAESQKGTISFASMSPNELVKRARPSPPAPGGLLQFTWFAPAAFHTLVRLSGGNREGQLIDCGAVENLCGQFWAERTEKAASKA